LVRAVSHALTIISWQENLTQKQMPPEWMWTLDDELEEWFDEINESFGASSVEDEEPPMMKNTLARGRGR